MSSQSRDSEAILKRCLLNLVILKRCLLSFLMLNSATIERCNTTVYIWVKWTELQTAIWSYDRLKSTLRGPKSATFKWIVNTINPCDTGSRIEEEDQKHVFSRCSSAHWTVRVTATRAGSIQTILLTEFTLVWAILAFICYLLISSRIYGMCKYVTIFNCMWQYVTIFNCM